MRKIDAVGQVYDINPDADCRHTRMQLCTLFAAEYAFADLSNCYLRNGTHVLRVMKHAGQW